MKKLIVSDLDGTIIDISLEKNFITYLFREDKLFFYTLVPNIIFHHIFKFFYFLFNKNFKFKFYYYGLSLPKIKDHVSNWLSQLRIGGNLRFNKKLLDIIDSHCRAIIVTNCPSFISKPFYKEFLKHKFNFLVGTQILIDTQKNKFHYKLEKKIYGKEKMKVLDTINNKSTFYTIGFGDTPQDLYFLEMCNEYYYVTGKDFI